MLFHDINPQLMYLEQHGKQDHLVKEVNIRKQNHLSISLNKVVGLFHKTKTSQSVCCACAC
ncbi:hypothetical protein J2736_005190 [Paenibacillus qinlingensis]|uniref:Uncharacterized protein n=1 Tax=Paenibacillus qinlingensis TaxID=1837343 RepID=A0ABU1P2K6_9BACL|nr:hypothetical protein [Paenibacillus qinlingensis]